MFRRVIGMFEAFRQGIMQSGDSLACFDGQFLLLDDTGVLVREQTANLVDMIRQFRKRELRLRRTGQRVGFQIVEAEKSEIAGEEDGRAFRWGEGVGKTCCLFHTG